MSNWKKAKGYADGGEITNEVEETSGVRLGQNANIDDDTRARALALANMRSEGPPRGSVSGSAKSAPKSAPKAEKPTDTGDETGRLARFKAPSRGMTNADDPSIPKLEVDMTPSKWIRVGRAGQARAAVSDREVSDGVGRAFDGAGPLALAGTLGVKAVRGGMKAARQAEGVMASGAKRASETRDRMGALREGRERAQEAAKARETAQESARASRRSAKDADEVNFADEGNPNFARGGQVGKKAHMKAEMAALRKGGAPKAVMAEEKAEYGMKVGGMVGHGTFDYGKK